MVMALKSYKTVSPNALNLIKKEKKKYKSNQQLNPIPLLEDTWLDLCVWECVWD